jgi:MSHA biogenesis protein MshO
MATSQHKSRSQDGFTLIELVVVMTLTMLIAGVMGTFMVRPMEGYIDMSRRAELIDVAQSAIQRIARDARRALPNSVRVSGDQLTIEILHTMDGGRYRAEPGTNAGPVDHTGAADVIDFAGDTSWNALGRFNTSNFTYGVALPAGTRVSIYPIGTNVYDDAATDANPGMITASTSDVTIENDTDEDQVNLSASHEFPLTSPRRRMYIVDSPVTFQCNTGAGTLYRYSGYSIAATQPENPAIAPLNAGQSALVTNKVSACAFTYAPGTSERAALITLDFTVAEAGEQVRLLHQIHVSNVP